MKNKSSFRRRLTLTILALSLLFAVELCARERPGSHPDYVQGRRALKVEDWETAAESMKRAIGRWEEDGEPTRVYGRWSEPYLPRFYLGKALHRLGCHQQAIDQFDHSILNREEIKRAKKIKQQMEILLLEAEQARRKGKVSVQGTYCKTWEQKVSLVTPGGSR